MTGRPSSAGFSLIELMVGLALTSVVLAAMASLTLDNARVDKSQLMRADVQSNARTTLSLIVSTLRTAGWDPRGIGFASVVLDSNPTDGVETLQIFADLNADGDTNDAGENVTIRQYGRTVDWRTTSDTSVPFQIIGTNIDNDANGDGVPELMFTPNVSPNPTRITVRITATAPQRDPTSGQAIHYSVSSDVLLRNGG